MSAEAKNGGVESARQTVYDLARQDGVGHGIPGGEKADFVTECADDHMELSVSEFSRNVIGTQVSDSYIRKVLKEQNPAAFGISVEETVFK